MLSTVECYLYLIGYFSLMFITNIFYHRANGDALSSVIKPASASELLVEKSVQLLFHLSEL